MDRTQEMTSFIAVVDAGSFIGAADATGLSKASLSRHVAMLEQRLGVRLLNRTTRRLSLTDEGQRFHARAKELLAALEEIESEISARADEASGLLRINVPQTFGILHLAPLWPRFLERHPKVTLDVVLNDRVVDLVEEGYDLAVRITSLPNSQLIGRRLASTRIVACASPAYIARHGMPVQPAELARHRVISYSYWAMRDEWSFSGPNGAATVRTRPVMYANNGDTCRAAALDGQGVILQPDFLVGPDLRNGTLVEVMPDYRAVELGIHALYPSRRHLPVKSRRMVDFLVESLATPPWA